MTPPSASRTSPHALRGEENVTQLLSSFTASVHAAIV
jgi:hypothetical protein